MHILLPVFLLLLGHSAFVAQQLSNIEGVVASSAGEPLNDARVILRREGSVNREADYGTSTRSGGRFGFKDVAAGRYRLAVTMPGFVRREYGQKRPNGPATILDLTTPQAIKDLKISLVPGATIAGKAYDQNGRPLPRVTIQALASRYVKGVRTLVLGASTQTDDLGEYRMYWTNPGQYFLLATPPRIGNDDEIPAAVEQFDGNDDVYPPIFYPNAYDELGARPLHVEPGADLRGIDFVLTRLRAVKISGRILDSTTHSVVPGANVSIRLGNSRAASASVTLSTRTDSQGRFELRRVIPGTYTLHAMNAIPGSRTAMVRREIQVGDKDVTEMEVQLQPPVTVNGRMMMEEGAKPPVGPISVALTPLDGLGGYGSAIQPDGTFVINSVEPNVYRLEVSGLRDSFYVRSARAAGNDILQNALDLREGAGDAVELLISSKAGSVDGSVTDAQQRAATGALVALVPAASGRDRYDLFKTTTTDQLGRFSIQGVVPGDYRVFAWEDIEPGSFYDPSVLDEFGAQSLPVHVDEDGHTTTNLHVIPVR